MRWATYAYASALITLSFAALPGYWLPEEGGAGYCHGFSSREMLRLARSLCEADEILGAKVHS